jgi:hypothetical protein
MANHTDDTESELADPSYHPHADDEDQSERSDESTDDDYPEDDDETPKLQLDPNYKFDGNQMQPYRCDEPTDRRRGYRQALSAGIGYRVWNENSQGINSAEGIFAGSTRASPRTPPSRNDPYYIQRVIKHLQRVQEPSPLISIWWSSIAAIHKLVTLRNSEVSFINLEYIIHDTTPHFDDRTTYPRVLPAERLISQYRLKDIGFPNGNKFTYRGDPEMLVWQHIEKHAIISTLTRAEFELHLNQNSDLREVLAIEELSQYSSVSKYLDQSARRAWRNRHVGFAIGRLLKRIGVPERFVQNTGLEFARGFEFMALVQEKERKGARGDRYLDGLWKGWKSSLSRAGVSATPSYILREPLFPDESDIANKLFEKSPTVRRQERKARAKVTANQVRFRSSTSTTRGQHQAGSDGERQDLARPILRPKTPNETFAKQPGRSRSSVRPPGTILFRELVEQRNKEVRRLDLRLAANNRRIQGYTQDPFLPQTGSPPPRDLHPRSPIPPPAIGQSKSDLYHGIIEIDSSHHSPSPDSTSIEDGLVGVGAMDVDLPDVTSSETMNDALARTDTATCPSQAPDGGHSFTADIIPDEDLMLGWKCQGCFLDDNMGSERELVVVESRRRAASTGSTPGSPFTVNRQRIKRELEYPPYGRAT